MKASLKERHTAHFLKAASSDLHLLTRILSINLLCLLHLSFFLMESGNSGSLQSSSGGDDEYADSTPDSISAFLNSSTPHMPAPLTHPTLLSSSSSHYPHQPSSSLFGPLSNYFDVFSRSTPPPNPISPLNLDMGAWSRALTSQTISTTTAHMLPASLMASLSSSTQPPTPNQNPSFSLPQAPDTNRISPSDQITTTARPSKKRSRASRRAPTTVLTTDTTNFRAMVQEFTGIPAPPFSASPFPQGRFDLFNNTAGSSTMRSAHLEQTSRPPPYLLRPFAHKVQPPPYLSSSPASNMNTSTTSNSNYQLLSELGISKGSMQNPILTFQSLQSSQGPLSHARSMGTFEDFNLQRRTTDHLSELHNFVNVGHGDDKTHLPSFDQNYATNSHLVNDSGSKMKYPPSGVSSSGQHDKGSDQNLTSRPTTTTTTTTGEGIVDSWICSSD